MKVIKPIVLAFSALFIVTLYSPTDAFTQATRNGVNKVVIDAGHGGQDPGAVNKSLYEKNITLNVALRLGALIKSNYPLVEVIYTRKTDVFIPLIERGDIANRANADLFISIHVNSARNSSATGTETLIMGADAAGKNLDIAMKENDVITYEEDYTTKYQGYTPGSSESFIMFSLMQYSFQSQSYIMADLVQKHFSGSTKMVNRGVKQAGVLVLWRTAMPSVLTEFGFISSPQESKFVGSQEGQEMYARCVFNAFSEYKTVTDGRGTKIVIDTKSTTTEQIAQNVENNTQTTNQQDITQSSIQGSGTSSEQAKNQNSSSSAAKEGKPIYSIQIMSSDRKIAKNSQLFGKYRGEIVERIINKLYKYYIGSTSSYQEALSLQSELRKTFKGAFIVPFIEERQLTVNEARGLGDK